MESTLFMDAKNALEAVEAIRNTVPEAQQSEFDAGLVEQFNLIAETVGHVAVGDAIEPETNSEIVPETKESIVQQLGTALDGYSDIVDAFNKGLRGNKRIEAVNTETLQAEFDVWLTDKKLAVVNEMKETNPDLTFTLVATPNILTSSKDVAKIAKAFGKGQPYETYVWDELYSRYSAEQLSGVDPNNDNAVNLSLIAGEFLLELERGVVEQRNALTKLKVEHPELKVPSVLDAVTYWATLRAQGNKLANDTTFDKTYIRHFDLPEQRLDGWLYVPSSCVSVDGKPNLSGSCTGFRRSARVAVG